MSVCGVLQQVAGNGQFGCSGDGGPALEASLMMPVAVTVDDLGHTYISDLSGMCIRKVDAESGVISTVAGGGEDLDLEGNIPDGGQALAAPLEANCIAIGPDGKLYLALAAENRVRRVDLATGIIEAVAGDGIPRLAGDGGLALHASLNEPSGLAFDSRGDLYIADSENHRVRKVNASTGIIVTAIDPSDLAGQPGGLADLGCPGHVALDSQDNLYIGFTGLRCSVVRRDAASGLVTVPVPPGTTLCDLSGMAVDRHGQLFVSDGVEFCVKHLRPDENCLRRITPAMSPPGGHTDPLLAPTGLCGPRGLAVDPSGDLLLADFYQYCVFRLILF